MMSEKVEKKSRLERRLERVTPDRTMLFSAGVLKWIAFACVCMNTFSVSVVQKLTMRAQAAGMDVTILAAIAVTLAMLAVMAIPMYAKLLTEGWKHTASPGRYLARLLGLALVSEIPYDLAVKGDWMDLTEQNPVWGLALSLVVLMLFRWMCSRGKAVIPLQLLTVLAACGWATILKINCGVMLVLLTAAFFMLREHRYISLVTGILFSAPQFPAPLGMLFVHCYGGQPAKHPKWIFYLLYPLQFLVCWYLASLI